MKTTRLDLIFTKRLRNITVGENASSYNEVFSNDLKSYIALLAEKLSSQYDQTMISRWTGVEIEGKKLYEHDTLMINNDVYEVVFKENRLVLV